MYSPYPPLLVPTSATFLGYEYLFFYAGDFGPVSATYEKYRVNRNPTYTTGTVDVLHFQYVPKLQLISAPTGSGWGTPTIRDTSTLRISGDVTKNNLGHLFGNGLSYSQVRFNARGSHAGVNDYTGDSWIIRPQTSVNQYVATKFQSVSSLGSPPTSSGRVFNIVKKRIGSEICVIGALGAYSWPKFPSGIPTYYTGIPFQRGGEGASNNINKTTPWLAHFFQAAPYHIFNVVLGKTYPKRQFYGDSVTPMVFNNAI